MEYAITRFETDAPDLEVVERYGVGRAKVIITRNGRYLVREPVLSEDGERIWRELMTTIHDSFPLDLYHHDEIIVRLKEALEIEAAATSDFQAWKREREAIEYYMIRDITGHGELDVLVQDPHIEDILAIRWDSPVAVVHRDYPRHTLLETNVVFTSEENMSSLIHRIAQRYGEPPSETRPQTSFTSDSGVRYTFTGNRRITPDSPTASIRKPSPSAITIFHLMRDGILSSLAAAYLWCIMDLKGFGLVIGAPSAGKTTMINAIFTMSNPNWHYYTIEDVLELRLPHKYVSRHTTTANTTLLGEQKEVGNFGVFDLCKLSLRFRPDFVVVGEILGQEAHGLVQVAASGNGCMCSFHANNAEHALTRLEAPPIALSTSQTGLITYVLHMSWVLHDNRRQRKLISITEINQDGLERTLTPLFTYDPTENSLVPDDVDALLEKSQRIHDMKIMMGEQDIRGNLEARMEVLGGIVRDGASDVGEIHGRINRFYDRLEK